MTKRNSLQPKDWVIAAMSALAERGVDAVSVEAIAKQLGTTKGSFYWHFVDRGALLEAVLELWEREGTADLITRAKAMADPQEGLRVLARDTLDVQSNGVDVARTETAIRAWAARDAKVGERFARIEDARTAFLGDLMTALGYEESVALQLSKVLHLTVIGLFAARASGSSLAEDETLNFLVERLIADAAGR